MSADNYLFIDQETLKVYHRFASTKEGGLELRYRVEILGEDEREPEPAYEAEDLADAIRYCNEFGWTEYGISVGTLCPVCRDEVYCDSEGGEPGGFYPHCLHCGAISELKKAVSAGELDEAARAEAERAINTLDEQAVLKASAGSF